MAAFTSGSTGTYYDLLKNVYEPLIQKQVNEEVPLLERIKESTTEVQMSGRGLTWAVDNGRVASFRSMPEDGSLPPSEVGDEVQATATPKDAWGRVEFTKRTMGMSKAQQGAFANVITRSMEKLKDRAKENLGRQLIGNVVASGAASGVDELDTGVLGLVNTADNTGTTIDVDNGNIYHFYVGQKLRIGTSSGSAITGDNVEVTGVDPANNQIDVTSFTWVNDDVIVEGDANGTAYQNELVGLQQIASDVGDLYGVTATNSPWRGYVLGNGGTDRNWSASLMDKTGYGIRTQSGKYPELIVCHNFSMLEIPEELRNDIRYAPQDLKGGFKRSGLRWMLGDAELEILTDDFVEPGTFLFLSPKDIRRAMVEPLGFLDDDGRNMLRVADKVNFEMIFGCIMELCAFRRNTHGKLEDIAVDSSNLPPRF